MQLVKGFAAIFFILSGEVYGQTKIRIETEDHFVVKDIKLRAWTPFGLEVLVTRDSSTHVFLLDKPVNRIRVEGENYFTLDSILKPEIPVGSGLVFIVKVNDKILEQIVISTSKYAAKLKESLVSISILKPYLIENKITTDISHALEQVPGVSIADNQINIRNGNGWSYGAGSRVMVLVDDLPMLSADAQTAQFSFMPVENVGSVEIVKSAGSVLYGSSALNGIVNIRSAEPTEKVSAKVSAFAGFFDHPANDSLHWNTSQQKAYGLNGYWSQKIGNNAFTASANCLKNEGYRMNEFDNRARMTLKWKHFDKHLKGLCYGLSASGQKGESGSFLLWESFSRGYKPLDSGHNYSKSGKLAIDPFLEYKGVKWKQQLLHRALYLDNRIDNGDTSNNQSNGSSLYYTEYKASTDLFRHQVKFYTGGIWMQGETHSPLFNGKQKSRNLAAYLQLDFKRNRLHAQAGARLENYKLNQFEQTRPVFRAGAGYTLAKYTMLRASWGQGYRFPSMAEAFISTTAGSVSIYPNPNLLPETGSNAEIGIKQGIRIGRFKGFADLAAFQMDYKNLMEFTFAQWGPIAPPLFGAGFKSVNTPKARIRGIEAEITAEGKIGITRLVLLTGYTYTSPINTAVAVVFATDSTGNKLSFENTRAQNNNYLKYRYKHLFRWDLQCNYKHLEFGWSVRYNSALLNYDKAFIAFPLNTVIPDIERAFKTLDHVLVTDIRMGWNFNKNWKMNFQILNLFNSLYMNRPADLRPPRSFQLQGVWFI